MGEDVELGNAAREVMVAAGGQKAAMLRVLALIDPGAEVRLRQPRFTSFGTAAQMLGGRVVPGPTRDDEGFMMTPKVIEARDHRRNKKSLCSLTPTL